MMVRPNSDSLYQSLKRTRARRIQVKRKTATEHFEFGGCKNYWRKHQNGKRKRMNAATKKECKTNVGRAKAEALLLRSAGKALGNACNVKWDSARCLCDAIFVSICIIMYVRGNCVRWQWRATFAPTHTHRHPTERHAGDKQQLKYSTRS